MRISNTSGSLKIWLSANDTYNWANKAGAKWPCSQLSGHRLYAEFDNNDLIDVTIDGKSGVDVDSCEFNAIIDDYLKAYYE